MRLVGEPATCAGVAHLYQGVVDGIVVDRADSARAAAIEGLGVAVLCTDIVMRTEADRERLAAETLEFTRKLT
jgi:LPPG:FO 2-phospho-L-lactate transferase